LSEWLAKEVMSRLFCCVDALLWWTSFVASKLDDTRSNWLHAGKQQSTDLCAGEILMDNTNAG
jgi:hypothetical protein